MIRNTFITIASFFLIAQNSFAIDVRPFVPGSAEPGVIGKTLEPGNITEQSAPKSYPVATAPQEQPSGLQGAEAQRIKFIVKKIILEGNKTYSTQELESLYKNKLNTKISVAELQGIVQSITNYYRNNGYILSRAVIPPQHIANGVVHVSIVEGFIEKVTVIGVPKRAKSLIEAYGKHIAEIRPLKISTMEYYLRLANDIPGVSVKAVLEPSKTTVGASDLNLSSQTQTFQGFISYDNYGTLYMGPNQVTATGSLNSMILSGDSTRLFYVTTSRPKELKFVDLTYQLPLGSRGLTLSLDANNSLTRPGLNLAYLKINGDASTYSATLAYPWIRSRSADLSLDGSFNYFDSRVVTDFDPNNEGFPLYSDHIRTLRFGGNFNNADRFSGLNTIQLHLEQGLNILGSTNNANSLTTSRVGGQAVFTKLTPQISRSQSLPKRFSLFLLASGQYSFNPLLSSEQVAYGGSQLGRGYDPAEIIGDRGLGGTVELRLDVVPGFRFFQSMQPYVFYDAAAIWNIQNVINVKKKQSITSTGLGIRFYFMKNLSGNLMIAQPLTKQDLAEAIRGNGRRPRGFFSITAYI